MSATAPFPTTPDALIHSGQPLSTWTFLCWLWRKPGWGALVVILATLLVGWGCLALFFPATGGQDLYWYLSSGHLIAQQGLTGRPLTDPFAYSTRAPYDSRHWLNHEWLFTWLIYQVWRLADFAGLVGLKYLLLLSWGGSLIWMGHRLARDWVLGFLTALVTIPLLAEFCDLRPQLITYCCTTLLLATWIRLPRRFWLATGIWLGILIFWANCHSAVILGVLLLAALLLAHAAGGQLSCRNAIIALFLVVLVPLLNPYGVEVYLYPLSWLEPNPLRGVIQEWRPVAEGGRLSTAELTWLLWPLMLLVLLLRPAGKMACQLTLPLGLLLAIYLMPVQASRHLPLAHIAFAAWWMLQIAGHTSWLKLEETTADSPTAVLRPGLRLWAECLALLLLVVSIPLGRWGQIGERWPRRLMDHLHPADQFPTGAWAFLQQYDLDGKIFNFYDWGGWLTWQITQESPPRHQIAIDGRLNTVYSDPVIAAYGSVITSAPEPLTARDGWPLLAEPADIALLPTLLRGQPVDVTEKWKLLPDWAVIYEDPVATLLVRRSRVEAEFIERAQGLHLAVPDDPQAHYGRALQVLSYGDVAGATRELQAVLRLDPHHRAAREQLEVLQSLALPESKAR